MLTIRFIPSQVPHLWITSAIDSLPSIAQYIKKYSCSWSDNDAFQTGLYELLGQDYINSEAAEPKGHEFIR